MRTLWLGGAAAAAFLCGTMAGCASPAYPIDANQPQGAAPLAEPRPHYPIDPASPDPDAARPAARSAPPAADDPAPSSPPLAAPVAPVESQPLPPPSAEASPPGGPHSDGARLQYAALSTPVASESLPPAAAPPATAPVSTATDAAPAAPPPAATAPAAAVDTALTPQMVVHDRAVAAAPAPTPAPPPARLATASSRQPAEAMSRHVATTTHLAIDGEVVHATGDIFFENYEVQRGDHIDALARAFSTTRKVILDANEVRPPYLLHPGEILKVPVTRAYVARSGDTLSGVARRFSVNPGELAEINHLSARTTLHGGQEVGLPSSIRDRGPQRVTTEEAEYAEAEPPARAAPEAAPPVRIPTPKPAAYAAAAPPRAESAYAPAPVATAPVTPPPMHRVVQVIPAPATPIQRGPTGSSGYIAQPAPNAPSAAGYSDAEIALAARGRFVWPVRGDILQKFGPQGLGRRNDGVDIRAAQGSSVKAAASGEVVYAGDQVPGFGNLVLIKHADGWVTAYAYLDTVDVAMKQQVSQGQALGSVGMTGGALTPELHFEVRYAPTPADKAKPVDPVLVLPTG